MPLHRFDLSITTTRPDGSAHRSNHALWCIDRGEARRAALLAAEVAINRGDRITELRIVAHGTGEIVYDRRRAGGKKLIHAPQIP